VAEEQIDALFLGGDECFFVFGADRVSQGQQPPFGLSRDVKDALGGTCDERQVQAHVARRIQTLRTRVTLAIDDRTRDTTHTTRHDTTHEGSKGYGRQGLEGFIDYVGFGVAREQIEKHVPDAGHQAVQAPLRHTGNRLTVVRVNRSVHTRHDTTRANAPQASATHLDTVAGSGSCGGRRPSWSVLASAVSSVDFLFRFCASV
jgi:hypothetical protein